MLLRESICLHYQRDLEEKRETSPLCPIKTLELASLQNTGLQKNKYVLRES